MGIVSVMPVSQHNMNLVVMGIDAARTVEKVLGDWMIEGYAKVAGGLPRDVFFHVDAKDADVVVYGRKDWASLNDHDDFFDDLEDHLDVLFDGSVANMTEDNSGITSAQPDNDRVYRVYSCAESKVNIIFYQGCSTIEYVVRRFDNTINAFWIERNPVRYMYDGDTITAIANPFRVCSPERDVKMRGKAMVFGLEYVDNYDCPRVGCCDE